MKLQEPNNAASMQLNGLYYEIATIGQMKWKNNANTGGLNMAMHQERQMNGKFNFTVVAG